MSIDILVHIPEGRVPTPDEWQSAITKAGFPVMIDTDFNLHEFSGFLPCKFKEMTGGFEYYYSVVEKNELTEIGVPENLPVQISFVTHTEFAELATAVIASAVLTDITGGLLMDTEEGKTFNGNEALVWARKIIKELSLPTRKPWWKFW